MMAIRKNQACPGFTLLEVMIVLVVTAIVLGTVVSRFSSGSGTFQFKSAARDVASGLRYARMQAVTGNRIGEFVFDLEANEYTVTGRNKRYSIADDISVTLYTSRTAEESEREGIIRFFPDGSSSGGRVTLETKAQRRFIDINWLTGHVLVIDPDAPQP